MSKTTKIDLIKTEPNQGIEKPHGGDGDDPKASTQSASPESAPEKRKKPMWMAALAGLLLLGGVAFAFLQLGWISIPGLSRKSSPEPPPPQKTEMGATVKLSPLVINLKEESGRHYLKVTVVLEVLKKDWVEDVQKKMSSMTDTVLVALSDKPLEEMKRPQSKEALKHELLTKINEHFEGQKIRQIYFDEFLYQ
jgi:flagellar FliL protein